MKRILIIDDLRIFDPLPDEEITHVRTLPEAYRNIDSTKGIRTNGHWDEVWLDHDLGGDTTIRPFVETVEECAHCDELLDVGMFVIITDNPSGRDWMIAALRDFYPVEVGKREYRIDWDATRA